MTGLTLLVDTWVDHTPGVVSPAANAYLPGFVLINTHACVDTHRFVAALRRITYLLRQEFIMNAQVIMARSLAPEDILPGTYVMVLHEKREFLHAVNPMEGNTAPMISRLDMRPDETELPRIVVAVNLPFVVVKNYQKRTSVIDTRTVALAKVSKKFARAAITPNMNRKSDYNGNPACEACKDN